MMDMACEKLKARPNSFRCCKREDSDVLEYEAV